jgi:AcrR family transcriptional regulator
MRGNREEKVNRILKATLEVLSKKGYENTTINDIADTAKLSRGLLHYYFKDKEDLVAQAMSFGFGSMWDSSIGSLQNAGSPEALVDSMTEVLKKNVRENPDLTALLFEMWVSGRRSAKIKKVFDDGLSESINRLKTLLEFAARMGVIKIDPVESEGIVRTLLAMYHGLAMQLLSNPKKAEDEKIWAPIKRTLILMMTKKSR